MPGTALSNRGGYLNRYPTLLVIPVPVLKKGKGRKIVSDAF